jgi:L-malate glycosyltransferase
MMHIALCTPILIDLFDKDVDHTQPLPKGFTFPLAYYLAMACLHAGHRVSVVTSANDVSERMEWQGYGGRLCVIVTPRRRTVRHSLDCYRREVRLMGRELSRLAPDLIHAQWTYEHADAAFSTGIPTIVTANDAPWLVARHFRQGYRVFRAVYASLWVIPRIRYLTAVSEHIAHYYKKEPFCRPQMMCVVPNGLSRALFAEKPKLRIRDPNAPVFVAISGWNRLKNLVSLLKAFQIVQKLIPHAQLNVIGVIKGNGKAHEKALIKAGLLNGVTIVGRLSYQETLAILENDADIVVHPTREESFSMVTLEAMAKGVPVIGGLQSGAVPWLLDYGKAGVVVNINQPQSIAKAMVELVNDSKLYATLAQNAHQRALEHFTLDKVVERYLAVYQNVFESAQKGMGDR